MERARLERLKRWIGATFGVPEVEKPKAVSQGAFTEFPDFCRVLELARAGLLDDGKKLQQINYRITARDDPDLVTAELDQQRLSFYEMLLEKQTRE